MRSDIEDRIERLELKKIEYEEMLKNPNCGMWDKAKIINRIIECNEIIDEITVEE